MSRHARPEEDSIAFRRLDSEALLGARAPSPTRHLWLGFRKHSLTSFLRGRKVHQHRGYPLTAITLGLASMEEVVVGRVLLAIMVVQGLHALLM